MNIKKIINESINSYVNKIINEGIIGSNENGVLEELTEYLKENPTSVEPGRHTIDFIQTENYTIDIDYDATTNAYLDKDEGDYYTAPQDEIMNPNDFEFQNFTINYSDANGEEGQLDLDTEDMYEIAKLFNMNYNNYEFDSYENDDEGF